MLEIYFQFIDSEHKALTLGFQEINFLYGTVHKKT